MPSRDVEINLIGNDRTGAATRSAANNLDQLARKIDKFNAKTIGDKKATVKTKVDDSATNRAADKLKTRFGKAGDEAGSSFASRFRRRISRLTSSVTGKVKIRQKVDFDNSRFVALGRRAGNVFTNALVNTLNDGSRAIGNAIRRMVTASPALQAAIPFVAARLAALLGQAITAAFALAIGPGLLAGPIAFLLIQQGKAMKQVTIQETKIAALRKRLNASTNKDTQERLRKEIAAEQRILREQEKRAQSLNRLKDRAKAFMEFISRPLQIPLAKALDEVGNGLDRLRGPVREIIGALAPELPGFTRGIMDTFLNFINALKPALPGVVAGMRAWGKELPKIGTALGSMVADILKNPGAVVASVTSISGVIQDLAAGAGRIVHGLTLVGQAFTFLETNINALEAGNLGGTTGFFRGIARAAQQMAIDFTGAISTILGAMALLNPTWRGAAAAAKAMHMSAKADMAAMVTEWAATDAAIRAREIKAKITADIAGLEAKLAVAKAKLKDPHLSKAKKIKIQANIADLELKISIGKAGLAALAKKKTKPKIHAAIDDLQAKIKTARSKLKGVHNSKTRAKIKGDIAAAEAAIATLKRLLKSIPDEDVKINVTRTVQFLTKPGSGPNERFIGAAGPSWQGNMSAALSGGGTSRTGGPTQVNVEAPNVNVRAFFDGKELDARIEATVRKANSRDTHRARVGRR